MFSFMIVCGLSPGVGGKCFFTSFNFFHIFAKFTCKQSCSSVKY